MDKRFDVAVAGELNVDVILNQVAGLPEIGKEILSRQMNVTLGSSAAIFASNLSTLGMNVAFAGKLGRDIFGDMVLSSLKAKGVNTDHIISDMDSRTGITIVLNYGEQRANVTYPGAMQEFGLEDIDGSLFLQARHLHVSSIFMQDRLKKDIVALFKKAKTAGLTTSLDPQWDPSEKWDLPLRELLPYVDLFMPNAAELQALTLSRQLNEALYHIRTFANAVVVKNGHEGAYLWDGREMIHHPAFLHSGIADCIGAGDSFNAGFIHHHLLQRPLQECLAFGCLMGAVNTTAPGGTGAFESRESVRSISLSHFNYSF